MYQYIPPSFKLEVFSCPHCNAIAHQVWENAFEYDEYRAQFDILDFISIRTHREIT